MKDPAGLYLDLLTATLTGMVYRDPPIGVSWLGHDGYREASRAIGIDWPQHAPCMLGPVRLANIRACTEQVLADAVPGDLVEAGCWRGGTAIFMRALLAVHADPARQVWVCDSFAGLPAAAAAAEQWAADSLTPLAVPLPEVIAQFRLYGMYDQRVRFLPGWFADTLPLAPPGPLALIHLDGDLYDSQLAALTHLYPRLSPGGYVIIDDPQLPGCAKAIAEYRDAHRITEPAQTTADGFATWWRKDHAEEPPW